MTTDVTLYLVKPGDQGYSSPAVGCLSIRDVQFSGQVHEGQRCLNIGVETHPPTQFLTWNDGKSDRPIALSWLQLVVELRTTMTPRAQIGAVHIDQQGMLPISLKRSNPANWLWEIRPEDFEVVERANSNQGTAPIIFNCEITGLVKPIDAETGQFLNDIWPVRGSSQVTIELSHWQRLMQYMEYTVPPTQAALAGSSAIDHPSWSDSAKRLDNARAHHRRGEDYDALRECLSTLESLVTAPYTADSWKERLSTTIPEQKRIGIAEMLSGVAMFCNKIGHHRSRTERNASDDLVQMPLDHWEADLVLGAAQFATTYALRLRQAGLLTEQPSAPAATSSGNATPQAGT
jgi:hypothetical protein